MTKSNCNDCGSSDLVCADCLVYPFVQKVSLLVSRLKTHGGTGSRTEALKAVEDAMDEWGPLAHKSTAKSETENE